MTLDQVVNGRVGKTPRKLFTQNLAGEATGEVSYRAF